MCSFISHILLCISIHFLEIFIRHLTYIHAIVMLGECARACMWICLHVQSPALYVHSFPRTSVWLRECNLFTVTVNILHLVAQWPCANVFVLYATLNKVYLILSYLIFRILHLRENLARDCFTSTASTVTNSVKNIFTRPRYHPGYTCRLVRAHSPAYRLVSGSVTGR